MQTKIDKFFRILNIELKDLETDISIMIEVHKERKDKCEISRYVFLENTCILKEELRGIKKINDLLENYPIDKYENIDDLVADIDNLIKEKTKLDLMPDSVYALTSRKISKVLEYIHKNKF